MGLSKIGSRLLPTACVTGYRRVPDPPARMMPLYFDGCRFPMRVFKSRDKAPLNRILCRHPLPITSAGHRFNPGFVIQIPLNGCANSAFKSLSWTPSQFGLNFCGVHRIAAVVPRAVFDERNQLVVRRDGI